MRALKIFEIMLLVGFIIFLYNSASFGAELPKSKSRRIAVIDFTRPNVQVIEFTEPLEIIVVKPKLGVK
jgi:hypothetical protein